MTAACNSSSSNRNIPLASEETTENYEVPFKSSLSFISLVAFVYPLATLLRFFHQETEANITYDYGYPHQRYLQEENAPSFAPSVTLAPSREPTGKCDVTTNAYTVSTWEQIAPTVIIALTVLLLCLLGYELFRRDPIIGKYVYDRKRLTQPGRSPSPLMLSRSLWTGDDGDGENENNKKHRSTCCRVRPALLEFLFLNLDKNYVRYSKAANEARKEREKRGYYSCCRTGCYHDNCCNGRKFISKYSTEGADENYFTNDDGYMFYPGYLQDYSHIRQVNNASMASYSPEKKMRSMISSSSDRGAPEIDEVQAPKWHNNINDLFPEDDPRKFFAEYQPEGRLSLLDSVVQDALNSDNSQNYMTATDNDEKKVFSDGDRSIESAVSIECVESKEDMDSNKGEPICKSPEPSPTNPKTSTCSGFDEESKRSESKDENDNNECTLVSILPPTNQKSNNSHLGVVEEGIIIENEVDRGSETKPLKYPSRLMYFFLPPGFHNWTSAFEFVGYFFFIPGLYEWCHKHLKRIPLPSPSNHNDSNKNGAPSNVPLSNPGKELTEGDEELLRCAGLDTYLLLRLARFGFDVTCYPFLSACVVILPIYLSETGGEDDFYLSLTIEVIPNRSPKIIWLVIFTILLYIYIMRRLWLEWEVFIKLRHNFLAEGDTSFHRRRTYLKKYRNTCLVECVPESHRSDRSLKLAFESLFPGQIEHAEMIIDTGDLEALLRKRRTLIEKYDDIDACHRYENWRYTTWQQEGKLPGCCNSKVSEPVEPKVRVGGLFSKKKEEAFAYYDAKIKDYDTLADKAYSNIVETRLKFRDESESRSSQGDTSAQQFTMHNLYTLFVPGKVRRNFFGEQPDFFCGTGVVTFKDISSKQSAVQCNLSGQPYWMLTADAPDPRDLFWANIGVNRQLMESRKILVQSALLLGVMGWGVIVTYIHKMINWITDNISDENRFIGLISGYLPALVVSLILLWIPNLFLLLAMRVIRFKSHSQCDEFVLLWNTGYRLANIFFTFFSISLLQALECFRENPESYVRELSGGVIRQGAYLMNLIILATGQETMLQLLQWRSLIKQAVFRPLINQNKKSRRYLDWLNAAPEFEKSFIFGFFAPVLSYGLMIAMVFAFMAPIMLGVCSVFFWTATKVHMHNALFVYCQRCEGGGKLFYYWNRIVFITIYSSIVIFSGILALKQFAELGIGFLLALTLLTYCVDKSIENTFVIHSLHLPISIARIHDEEEVALLKESNMKPDGGENFMYRHPILNQENWNSKPTWR